MCAGLVLPLDSLHTGLPAGDWVDIGCAVAGLISIGLGSHRGLSAELPLGVGWFCGLLAGWYAYAPVHTFYNGLSFLEDEPEFLFFLTLITVLLLAWGAAVLVSRGLRLLAVTVEKGPADYVLGTVAGVIRAFLLLLIVTAVMLSETFWKSGHEAFCHQSRTGRAFSPWATGLLESVKKLYPKFEIHRRTDDPGDLTRPTSPSK